MGNVGSCWLNSWLRSRKNWGKSTQPNFKFFCVAILIIMKKLLRLLVSNLICLRELQNTPKRDVQVWYEFYKILEKLTHPIDDAHDFSIVGDIRFYDQPPFSLYKLRWHLSKTSCSNEVWHWATFFRHRTKTLVTKWAQVAQWSMPMRPPIFIHSMIMYFCAYIFLIGQSLLCK